MITGVSGWRSRICGNSSRPLWPGNARSSSTRSKLSCSSTCNPCSPSFAVRTAKPSRVRRTSSDSRMPASSSITRMLALFARADSAGAETGRFNGCSTSDMYRLPQQGELKVECCAGPRSAFNLNLAGMLLDNAVRDRQAQPCPATLTGLGHVLGGEKRIVDALQMLRCDARAGVSHDCFDVAVGKRGDA